LDIDLISKTTTQNAGRAIKTGRLSTNPVAEQTSAYAVAGNIIHKIERNI
jgi:hypothetical protein